MKHVAVITKSPSRAQLSTEQIITIVATSLTAIATVLSTVIPIVTGKD